MDATGKTLCGRYRLDGLLGAGGMGTVYAGTHLRLDRPVAVKLLNREVGRDATLVERFFREARTAAAVDSVGIVDVIDLDVDPELGPFMVMERLRGEGLEKVLPRGALAPERAVQIVADMLDVLGAVHARGVVHRDLKPPNVFLHRTEDGKEIVKVLDFGIAQLSFARITLEGAVIGTPRWMAPEQATGGDVDHRADLYAAGLLLYSCLSGQPPYHDVAARDIARHVDRGPTPLRTLAPTLPEALLQSVERALAADPATRFQSAAEMATALRASVSTQPEMSPSDSVSDATAMAEMRARPRELKRLGDSARRLGAAIVLAVLVIGVAVGTAVVWMVGDEPLVSGTPLLQLSAPIPSTCPIPIGDRIGVATNGSTFVWTGGGHSLRVTAPPGTHGVVSLNEPGIRVEVDTYGNTRFQGGTVTFHEHDPSRGRARIEFTNVTLFRADGASCTLIGTATSY